MEDVSAAAIPDPLRDVIQQVQDLQHRVSILEQRLGEGIIRDTPADPTATRVPDTGVRVAPRASTNFLPVLGRVLVVIAGAYILRALTDLGVMPRAAGIAVGILARWLPGAPDRRCMAGYTRWRASWLPRGSRKMAGSRSL